MKKQPQFLNIDPRIAADPSSRYLVIPVPYERTVSYGTGTAKGPAAILKASMEIEDFDEESKTAMDLDVRTLKPLSFKNLTQQQSMGLIRKTAGEGFKNRKFVLSIGGEHSITPPAVESAMRFCGVKSVLQFDAHTDLRDEFRGEALSHACAMRRCRDFGLKTVHVGIRSCSKGEYDYIRKGQISVFWANDIISSSDESWIDAVCRTLADPVYVSVDMDAFDPSLIPGTGTPEPGGLNWTHVIRLLKKVFSLHDVAGADIVETAPIPGTQVSEYTAARLGAKILFYHKLFSKK